MGERARVEVDRAGRVLDRAGCIAGDEPERCPDAPDEGVVRCQEDGALDVRQRSGLVHQGATDRGPIEQRGGPVRLQLPVESPMDRPIPPRPISSASE